MLKVSVELYNPKTNDHISVQSGSKILFLFSYCSLFILYQVILMTDGTEINNQNIMKQFTFWNVAEIKLSGKIFLK
jgi:hypothetical protein